MDTNPKWRWERKALLPIERDLCLKWKDTLPVSRDAVIEYGLDIVEIAGNRIARNAVYFDRIILLRALKKSAG